MELGKSRKLPIAIDITKGEQVLFHVALDGATPDNEHWIRAKQRTAARYEVPSLLVGLRGRLGGGRIEDQGWYDESTLRGPRRLLPGLCHGSGRGGHGDGLRTARSRQDHDLVVEALREILASMAAALGADRRPDTLG